MSIKSAGLLQLRCFLKKTTTKNKSTYHVPNAQNNGARPDMAAEAATRRVPAVPRRNHPQMFLSRTRNEHQFTWMLQGVARWCFQKHNDEHRTASGACCHIERMSSEIDVRLLGRTEKWGESPLHLICLVPQSCDQTWIYFFHLKKIFFFAYKHDGVIQMTHWAHVYLF